MGAASRRLIADERREGEILLGMKDGKSPSILPPRDGTWQPPAVVQTR